MLEPKGRKNILEIVKKKKKKESITIVYITQFMSEAAQFDKIFVLDKGRIVLEDSPKKILDKAEQLLGLSLEVPQITRLARELVKSGLDIPGNILNEDEMVKYLCLYI